MRTYYLEKKDKPKFCMCKCKLKQDNLEIYSNLENIKNVIKIVKRIKKDDVECVVISKELYKCKELITALNANNIKIFDGKWLQKYLALEILEYVVTCENIKKEEIEVAITTNEITDYTIEIIKTLAMQYKRVSIVTNHIEKLKKIEQELYEKNGILIVISNNQKKSLAKSQIILNLDFNKEVLNRYKINETAVIINIEGDMKIKSKRFNGININDYEIEVGREEIIWRENCNKFKAKDLLEAKLYMKDTFHNIKRKIAKNKVSITEVIGENGKIERFS